MDCRYCGEPAGFLRRTHPDCEALHSSGVTTINALLAGPPSESTEVIAAQVKLASTKAYISSTELKSMLVAGWRAALERFLDDGVLDEQEEHYLAGLRTQFDLTQGELDADGSFSRAAKAVVLRSVMNGDIPHVTIEGTLPFNFQKGEQTVWVFTNVTYLEDKTRRRYVGQSSGISVRVVKGLYYRTSSYRGHPIDYEERVRVDTGVLAVTDKNLYFSGPARSFKIPNRKILAFQPYSDGIGIVKDAASARPQTFVTHDGWFTHNLLTNLSHISD